MRCGGLALVLWTAAAATHVLASTAIVPDEFPAVQPAIDSGADTVLIREGTYAAVSVDRPVVLQGIGVAARPIIAGMSVTNLNFPTGLPPLVSAHRIHFSGDVQHRTERIRPRHLALRFTECTLAAGFHQGTLLAADDLGALVFQNCRLGPASQAWADQVVMEADTIDGGVSWRSYTAEILDCRFTGGAGTAIDLYNYVDLLVSRNHIRGYRTGMTLHGEGHVTIDDNTVRDCLFAAIDLSEIGSYGYVRNNELRNCLRGIYAGGLIYELRPENNRIHAMREHGIWTVDAHYLIAAHNIISGCLRSGIQVDGFYDPGTRNYLTLRNNTIFRNGGSGISLGERSPEDAAVEANIAFENGGWGLTVWPAGTIHLGCNDWFGNGSGAVNGVGMGATDLSLDALFCGLDSADVRLDSASPLLDAAGCGPIGALGVGCGETAALLQMMAVQPQGSGVVVRWRFGSAAPARAWLERAPAEAGPWRALPGIPEADGGTFELTDTDVEPGLTYWYRVGWQENAVAPVEYSSSVSYTIERLASRSRVFPNPSFGPAIIEWTLEFAANMDVRVYDLAGREVAAPARGPFGPGKYSTLWDGRRPDGGLAPAGWYVVRLRGGPLNAAHRLLLLR